MESVTLYEINILGSLYNYVEKCIQYINYTVRTIFLNKVGIAYSIIYSFQGIANILNSMKISNWGEQRNVLPITTCNVVWIVTWWNSNTKRLNVVFFFWTVIEMDCFIVQLLFYCTFNLIIIEMFTLEEWMLFNEYLKGIFYLGIKVHFWYKVTFIAMTRNNDETNFL